MNIKIIGNNSSNKMKLIKNLQKAIDNFDIKENINIDLNETDKKYNVRNTPALVINDNLISEGKVLTEREITKYIKENCYSLT